MRLKILAGITAVMLLSAGCTWGEDMDPTPSPTNTVPVTVEPTPSSLDDIELLHFQVINGIITDGSSRPVYAYIKDDPEQSNCGTECPETFRPVGMRDTVVALPPLVTAKLETTGSAQVAYNGHPLYYCVADSGQAGATCNSYNNEWFLLDSQGNFSR